MLNGIHNAIIIYNPVSGRGSKRRLHDLEAASRILRDAGISTEVAPTSQRGHAVTLARQAVNEGREMVIACGGDGTINEVVNAMAGTQIPLAILPAGTANILAKELGIPWDIPAAAKLIPGGTTRRIALGAVTPVHPESGDIRNDEGARYFLSVAGAGPDGQMVQMLEHETKQHAGIAAYWLEGFRQLFKYGFPAFHISGAGAELDATLLVVGRTQNYGGPFKITTGASLFEDSFELMAYTSGSRFSYMLALPALWLGRMRSHPHARFWKATEVRCDAQNGSVVFGQVDGEPIGPLPFHFRVVPDALTLVVPAREGESHS
jgi:diacylglycerol kinase (ATP)